MYEIAYTERFKKSFNKLTKTEKKAVSSQNGNLHWKYYASFIENKKNTRPRIII